MRVICINSKLIYGYNLANDDLELLKEGETYTVEQFKMTPNGKGVYFLKEVRNDGIGWSTLRFIPLSEIDETELNRNYKTELV